MNTLLSVAMAIVVLAVVVRIVVIIFLTKKEKIQRIVFSLILFLPVTTLLLKIDYYYNAMPQIKLFVIISLFLFFLLICYSIYLFYKEYVRQKNSSTIK